SSPSSVRAWAMPAAIRTLSRSRSRRESASTASAQPCQLTRVSRFAIRAPVRCARATSFLRRTLYRQWNLRPAAFGRFRLANPNAARQLSRLLVPPEARHDVRPGHLIANVAQQGLGHFEAHL